MHYFLTICVAFFGFVALIDSISVTTKAGADNLYLDCSKFKRDLDVLRSFSYSVQLNPLITVNKTYAVMSSISQIEELIVYQEISLPVSVFCLANLNTLRVTGTPFVPQFELDDTTISTGLSPLISRLSHLRVLSLVNTTASHIPHHALAALTNLTSLEIENCGLNELPPTIALLTKIQILKLPMNHLKSLPDKADNLNKSLIRNNMFLLQIQWEV